MFKNYFKTAWRNLVKNKFYSAINIAGLTIGLAVGLMIILWVQHETSFDTFHKESKNIYKVQSLVGSGTTQQVWNASVSPITHLAKMQAPGVKDATRITNNWLITQFKHNQNVMSADGNTVFLDPNFFTMFDFRFISGDRNHPFADNNSIVITQKTAEKLFGKEDPMGKPIQTENNLTFTVTGVLEDFPTNSNFDFSAMMPLKKYEALYQESRPGYTLTNDFNYFEYNSYLLLEPGIDLVQLKKKMLALHLQQKPDDTDLTYMLLNVGKIHLWATDTEPAGLSTVRMFTLIAIIILLIASINYVNLSTARAMLRSKEVSLRKIVGAGKFQLFLQFIIETALLFSLAAVFALVAIKVCLPYFNDLSGTELRFDLTNTSIWLVIFYTIVGTMIAASIYPALLLSSFEPLKALKGKIKGSISSNFLRKSLVVVQFGFSILLIIGTFVIGSQLKYMRSKELGFNKEHVIGLSMRNIGKHYDAVRDELLKNPAIKDVARGTSNVANIQWQTGNNDWPEKEPNTTFMVFMTGIDKDFIPFYKMKLTAGANFTGAVSDSTHYILNETAVREANIKDPIGHSFTVRGRKGTIIGVVKDFHFASLKKKIAPLIIFYAGEQQSSMMYVKTTGKDAAAAIATIEATWKKYNPNLLSDYNFLDKTYNRIYAFETRTSQLFQVFSIIAIFISCLGLFGLATYTAHVRTREIGVRKALGASVGGIITLLSKDFIQLVFISILISMPIAYFAMKHWLNDFEYRIALSWTVFATSGMLAILIALFTISFQSVKAALANPIKSLRSE
ncbi:putative ABC transport system permease protein [Chitinophaga skermanii]|uniref:Putative ABC transport system permease protein n=1 Tax=Chitinophaga skermanii TaxID=331697 RepID=A0A327Q7G7_9BACT|nr:ABC transporter permease [Chitinophaga skermanii]RAI99681.1 putative ABC transport system permease protein [Chitinophaga skermanii]